MGYSRLPEPVRTTSKHRLLERAGAWVDKHLRIELENRLSEHPGIDFETTAT